MKKYSPALNSDRLQAALAGSPRPSAFGGRLARLWASLVQTVLRVPLKLPQARPSYAAPMKRLALALLLFTTSAMSADIVFLRGAPERLVGHVGEVPDNWRPRIVLVGQIVRGDDKRFAEVLKQAETQSKEWETDRTLLLDSEGGDIAAAMSIGRMVRRAKLVTAVHKGSVCASACVVILAGGVWRYARDDTRLGLHRPYFSNPQAATSKGYDTFQQAYDSVLEAHRAYFAEMGIGNGLLQRMLQIPSNQVQWISISEASTLNLLGEDAAYAEWKRARRIAREGAECVEWQDNRYWPCLAKLGFEASDRCEASTRKPPQCK